MDKLFCKGLRYTLFVGFHDCEQPAPQELSIDLEVEVEPFKAMNDRPEALPFDYFKVNQLLTQQLQAHRVNLIETLAERVAELLLAHFAIASASVRVRKRPLDIPNVEWVACECVRRRKI